MARQTCYLYGFVFVLMLWECQGQQSRSPTTPAPTAAPSTTATTTPKPIVEEGLILTTHADGYASDFAQLRFLPTFPGSMSYNGTVPGLKFNNDYIQFLSADVDYRKKQLYLYDYHLRSIAICYNFTGSLDTDIVKFEFMHIGVSKGTIQIAVDWITGTVYWTDSVLRWVVAAPGDKEKIDMDLYKVILNTHVQMPDGLALDPLKGLMFISESGPSAKIERCTMTGENRHTIAVSGLTTPSSLEVDSATQRLYWIDRSTETIHYMSYDGTNRNRVKLIPQTSLFDLTIYKEMLYVTDIEYGDMFTLDKTTGAKMATTVNFDDEIIYGVAKYKEDEQPLPADNPDPCAALKCDHLCLRTATGAKCQCAENYRLEPSNNTCVEDTMYRGILFANSTHICIQDIRSFAYQGYREKCIFTVIDPPKPTPSTTTTKPTTPAGTPTPAVTQTPAATTTSQSPTGLNGSITTVPITQPPVPTTAATTPAPAPTAAPGDMIKMFDVDVENRVIYYVTMSNKVYMRPVDSPIENTVRTQPIQVSNSADIVGIAYNWLDSNLFWIEANGYIYAKNTKDGAVRTISNKQSTGARSLVLMAHERKLAWLTDTAIKMINIDGSSEETLVDDLENASYLTYDQHNKIFYWVNSKRDQIYMVNLKGEESLVYYTQDNVKHLTLYQGYIVWSYSSRDTTFLITYKTSNSIRVSLGNITHFGEVKDIKVLDMVQQPKELDPCSYENGGCSQICLTHMTNDVPSKKCFCALGYSLASDMQGCESTLTTTADFLLAVDRTNDAIYQVNLQTDDIQAYGPKGEVTYSGVRYYPKTQRVYYGDYASSDLSSAKLDGSDVMVHTNLGWANVEGIAIEQTTGNVYFTSSMFGYIGMVTPNNEEIVLMDTFWEILAGIALYPEKGYMYFSMIEDENYLIYIGRSYMDGTNEEYLIIGQEDRIFYPTGITIDYNTDHFYWSDQKLSKIEKCNLDATNCSVFLSDPGANITDIYTDGQYLYYTALNRHHVMQVSLTNIADKKVLGSHYSLGKLTHLDVYRQNNMNVQPENEACKERNGLGDCSTMCLPAGSGRTCGCAYGTDLKSDGRTCADIFQCDEIIYQTEQIEVTFFTKCNRYLDDQCEYKCPYGYVPIDDKMKVLTCNKDGWDRQGTQLCKELKCQERFPNGEWKSCDRNVGEKCSYTCNANFNPAHNFAVCTQDGTWDEDLNSLCSGHQCSSQIANGKLNLDCSRDAGSSCDYSCNLGYKKNPKREKLTCKPDFNWDVDTNTLCQRVSCPTTISNGILPTCKSYMPGAKCDYKCGAGYVKPQGVTMLTCLITEEWDAHGQDPCIAPQCPSSYTHGTFQGSCTKVYGSTCTVACNPGFKLMGYDKVVCSTDNTWQPAQLCTAVTCPQVIPDALLDSQCIRGINTNCNYTCPIGYQRNNQVKSVQCQSSGAWNQTKDLCIEMRVDIAGAQKSSSGKVGEGIGIGIGILLAVLIIVFIVGFILYKRRKAYKESPYSMSFDSQSNNIAIENPGYMQTNGAASSKAPENNYDQINTEHMQPVKFVGEDDVPADHGMVNPMFMEKNSEQLPEVSQIDLSGADGRNTISYEEWKNAQA